MLPVFSPGMLSRVQQDVKMCGYVGCLRWHTRHKGLAAFISVVM